MIVWSQQHRIISSLSLSFSKLEKIHAKTSNAILDRDKMFLRESKYQLYTEADFKFIVMWTVFTSNTSKIDTLKKLQQYSENDIKEINYYKEKLVLYKDTIEKDFAIVATKICSPKVVLDMYIKREISILYVYWYFNQKEYNLTRIKKRTVQRINFFMSYFPTIQDYLELIKY